MIFAEAFVPNLYGGKGAFVWVAASALLDEHGNRYGAIESVRDITDKKLVEAALRESERRFRILTEASLAGIYIIQEGVFRYVNPAVCRIFGYTESELVGRCALDLVHPDNRSFVARNLSLRLDGEIKELKYEFRGVRKDGAVIWCEELGTRIQYIDKSALMGTLIDITERKRTEASLERSSALLRNIIDSSADCIYVKDRELRTVLCNETLAKAIGKHPEDMVGKTDLENGFDPDLVKGNPSKGIHGWEKGDRLTLGGQNIHILDEPATIQGELRFFDTLKHPLRDRDGKIIGLFGISRDITERKRAEQELLRSEAALKEAQRIAHLGSWDLDINKNEVLWSEEMFRIFAWPPQKEPLPFGLVIEATYPDDRDCITAAVEESLKTHRPFDFEYRIARPDGSVRWIHTCGEVVLDEAGNVVRGVGTTLDITERKQAEDKVKESEKKFKSMTDTSPLAIYMSSGLEQTAEYINPTFISLFGYTLSDVPTASHWWPLAYPDGAYRAQVQAEWERRVNLAMKTHSEIEPMETIVTCKDGSKKNISWGFISTGLQDWSFGLDITERKQAEEALRNSEEHLRLSQTYGGIGTWEADLISNEQYWSEAVITSLGFPALEKPTWDDFLATILPEDRQRMVEAIQAHLDCGAKLDVEYRIMATDARTLWMRSIGQAERDADSTPLRLRGIVQDITERKRAEEALLLSNERFRRFVESNIVGIVIDTAEGVVLEANDYFLNLTGFTRQELERGQVNWRAITPPEWLPADEQALHEMRERGVCAPYEKEYVRRDGSRVPVFLACTLLPDPSEQIAVFCLDFTERKAAIERIKFLAHYDELTGLPKRSLLQDRWEMALAAAERNHWRVALLFLDLDRFKVVNDSLRHPIGDQLLRAVAERLKACLRHEDTLARTGGDEFILVLPALNAAEEAAGVAQKLRDAVRAPFLVDGHTLYVTLSIGIGLYPEDGSDFDILSRSADAALYRAKESGRDRYQFFTKEMDALARQRLHLENAIRRALSRDEFELHYQPQWDMIQGRIIGLEALLRWRDPELGWVPPAQFIPVAEKNHLILQIGEWVIRAACRQNRLWQAEGLTSVPVAVNISSLQFSQAGFLQIVAKALDETGLAPNYLELELTESILMEHAETTIATVHALKSMGLSLAIDDFGTGYSSLSYLKHLPIDKLKIAQSFVRDIASDPNDVMIIRAIIGLAGSLQLKVLAEGVETQAQCDFLRAEQCPEAQGYYFSRPLSADQMEALLRKSA